MEDGCTGSWRYSFASNLEISTLKSSILLVGESLWIFLSFPERILVLRMRILWNFAEARSVTSFLSSISANTSWSLAVRRTTLRVSAFLVISRSFSEVWKRVDLVEASISTASSLESPDWRLNLIRKPLGMILRRRHVEMKASLAVVLAKDTTIVRRENLSLSSGNMMTNFLVEVKRPMMW